jgi:hypothetical protein
VGGGFEVRARMDVLLLPCVGVNLRTSTQHDHDDIPPDHHLHVSEDNLSL